MPNVFQVEELQLELDEAKGLMATSGDREKNARANVRHHPFIYVSHTLSRVIFHSLYHYYVVLGVSYERCTGC